MADITVSANVGSMLEAADNAAIRTAIGLGTLATQSGTFSGTSSGTNTGDQSLAAYATTAAVAAGYQPLDAGLTALAGLADGSGVLTNNGSGGLSWAAGGGGGSGTVTSVGWTGGIVSIATGTTTPAFTIAGTSGGIPYFSSASTWATSAALAANALVVGGGAGVAPATVTTGTGVLTALGINIGSAGAPVLFNGAGGTPSSLTLTNATGLPVATGISGMGTGVATALAVNNGSAGGYSPIDGVATLTNKRITGRIHTLTDAATVTPSTDSYDGGLLATLSQTTTIANPTGTPTDFQRYTLRIKSTTARTLSFGAQFRWSADLPAVTATSGSSLTDYLIFQWNSADSKWDAVGKNFGF